MGAGVPKHAPGRRAMVAADRVPTSPKPPLSWPVHPFGGGVIGNTTGSGPVIRGSSPCPGARERPLVGWAAADGTAPSSSGLGHHPLKVAARVRIPLGLPETPSSERTRSEPLSALLACYWQEREMPEEFPLRASVEFDLVAHLSTRLI